ncbi:hypothetical protein GQ53DRAFT_839647 [Thozetella sp. PMI_491]|nr:hypothetical protein GQ53DRAFT_839647 [Thozetella sp. PMI_491]
MSGSSMIATATSLLALTTPFAQPPSCTSIWDLTTVTTRTDGAPTTMTILASNAADARFASCQPSGWATDLPARHFTFSPAVCPSSWTYWAMRETETIDSQAHTGSTFSTAYCCASGYTLKTSNIVIPTMAAPCVRSFSAGDHTTITATEGGGASQTTAITDGWMIHDAWQVSWAASDTSTLSPSLPTLTSSKFLMTWVPGQTVAPGEGDLQPKDPPEDSTITGAKWFGMVGVPILAALGIGGAVWYCIVRRRKAAQQPSTG